MHRSHGALLSMWYSHHYHESMRPEFLSMRASFSILHIIYYYFHYYYFDDHYNFLRLYRCIPMWRRKKERKISTNKAIGETERCWDAADAERIQHQLECTRYKRAHIRWSLSPLLSWSDMPLNLHVSGQVSHSLAIALSNRTLIPTEHFTTQPNALQRAHNQIIICDTCWW